MQKKKKSLVEYLGKFGGNCNCKCWEEDVWGAVRNLGACLKFSDDTLAKSQPFAVKWIVNDFPVTFKSLPGLLSLAWQPLVYPCNHPVNLSKGSTNTQWKKVPEKKGVKSEWKGVMLFGKKLQRSETKDTTLLDTKPENQSDETKTSAFLSGLDWCFTDCTLCCHLVLASR